MLYYLIGLIIYYLYKLSQNYKEIKIENFKNISSKNKLDNYIYLNLKKYNTYSIGTKQENIIKFDKLPFVYKSYENSNKILKDVNNGILDFGLIDSKIIENSNTDNIYAISQLDIYSHTFITLKDSNINNISDLKNKKISFGNKNSDSYEIGNMILNIYDISKDDYKLYTNNYNLNKLLIDLINNKLDAIYLNCQHPIIDENFINSINILDINKYNFLKLINLNNSEHNNELYLPYYKLINKTNTQNNYKYKNFFKNYPSSLLILICNKNINKQIIPLLKKNINISSFIPPNLNILPIN